MIKKINKLFVIFSVILFGFMFSSCASNSYEIKEGIYICDVDEYFGKIELNKISEEEFVSSNGLNVFKVKYDGKYKYFSIIVYVTLINNEEKISLNFNNLESKELPKISFDYYYFVDEDGHMINIHNQFISISYVDDNINIINDFYQN